MRKLFVWSLFKVGIEENDKFIYVDETRASGNIIRLDNRTNPGKWWMPWGLMVSGAMCWFALMEVSLSWGE